MRIQWVIVFLWGLALGVALGVVGAVLAGRALDPGEEATPAPALEVCHEPTGYGPEDRPGM